MQLKAKEGRIPKNLVMSEMSSNSKTNKTFKSAISASNLGADCTVSQLSDNRMNNPFLRDNLKTISDREENQEE